MIRGLRQVILGMHVMHGRVHPKIIKVLQLFCCPMTPLIIGLPFHPHPSGGRQFALHMPDLIIILVTHAKPYCYRACQHVIIINLWI